MHALHHALRTLDPRQFQLFVFDLLKEQYPTVKFYQISGAAGDEGLDIISGQLDARPTIWQCKSFSGDVQQSQKAQIRDSLNRALSIHTPKRWVLCLNCDLTPEALRWFQRLTASRASAVEIGLLAVSDIVHELLYRHSLRDAYFPQTVLNVPAVREALLGTDTFTDDELQNLNETNVQSYLARLAARDARFRYAATIHRDGPVDVDPKAFFTATHGSTSIQVYARDIEAVRADPPKATFSLAGESAEKFQRHIKTGAPVTFGPGEIIAFRSDISVFNSPDSINAKGLQLSVKSQPSLQVPMRVVFGTGDAAVTYDYVLFHCVQAGSEEATFQSTGDLPFRVLWVLQEGNNGRVEFTANTEGHNVRAALKAMNAISAAISTGYFELFDLQRSNRLGRGIVEATLPPWMDDYRQLLQDAIAVADKYNLELTVPSAISPEDVDSIHLLKHLPQGVAISIDEISFTLTRVDAPKKLVTCDEIIDCRITTPQLLTPVRVFGKSTAPGPIEYLMQARVKDANAYNDFQESPAGTEATIGLLPTSVSVRLISHS